MCLAGGIFACSPSSSAVSLVDDAVGRQPLGLRNRTANILFVSSFAQEFAAFHLPRLDADRKVIGVMEESFRGRVVYDPDGSAWDNTLLVPINLSLTL